MDRDKPRTNFEIIEDITGIPKQEQLSILEKVRDNHRRLDSCDYHDFSIDLTPNKLCDKKFRCTKCGGEVSYSDKKWYELGLKHSITGSK